MNTTTSTTTTMKMATTTNTNNNNSNNKNKTQRTILMEWLESKLDWLYTFLQHDRNI